MYKALVFKELRETIGIALIALLAYFWVIFNALDYQVYLGQRGIPFLDGRFTGSFCFISTCFAIALGLWQTVVESRRGTWLFLLHRPISHAKLIGVKLAVGVMLYCLVAAAVICIYAAWAATTKIHASPFAWWMTTDTWMAFLFIIACYFAAFLTGIRPGRWIGTRLLPIVALAFPATLFLNLFFRWWSWGFAFLIIVYLIYLCLIFFVARTRDFS